MDLSLQFCIYGVKLFDRQIFFGGEEGGSNCTLLVSPATMLQIRSCVGTLVHGLRLENSASQMAGPNNTSYASYCMPLYIRHRTRQCKNICIIYK